MHKRLALCIDKRGIAAHRKRLLKQRRPRIVHVGGLRPRVHRAVRAQQIGALGLLRQIEHRQRRADQLGKRLHHRRLAGTRLADQQRRLRGGNARRHTLKRTKRRPRQRIVRQRRARRARPPRQHHAADAHVRRGVAAARDHKLRHTIARGPRGTLRRQVQVRRKRLDQRVHGGRLGRHRCDERIERVKKHVFLDHRMAKQARTRRGARVDTRAPSHQLTQRDAAHVLRCRNRRCRLPCANEAVQLRVGKPRKMRKAPTYNRPHVARGRQRQSHLAPVRRRQKGTLAAGRASRQQRKAGRRNDAAARAQVERRPRADPLRRPERLGERRKDTEHIACRAINVLQNHPDARAHRARQRALDKRKRAGARARRDVRAEQLLGIDAGLVAKLDRKRRHARPQPAREVRKQVRLAARRRAGDDDRQAQTHVQRKRLQPRGHRRG